MTNIDDQMIDEEETKTVFTVRNMAIGGSVLLLAIGGGAFYYMKNKKDDTSATSGTEKTADSVPPAPAPPAPAAKVDTKRAWTAIRKNIRKAAAIKAVDDAAAAEAAHPPISKDAPSQTTADAIPLPLSDSEEVVAENATVQSTTTENAAPSDHPDDLHAAEPAPAAAKAEKVAEEVNEASAAVTENAAPPAAETV